MVTVGKYISFIVVGLSAIGIIVVINLLMTSSIAIEQTEEYIFKYINEERANRYLPVLGNDRNLTVASKDWSEYLISINELTHGDFNGRMRSIGYSYYSCGEIIGSFTSGSINGVSSINDPSEIARQFVNMWLDSPPHREIMLTQSTGFMGVGVSGFNTAYFGVVDFRFN
jgi:uncharacterized protein YkwD